MEKDELIRKLVADLRKWLRRDPDGFWDHIENIERNYLRELPEKELREMIVD